MSSSHPLEDPFDLPTSFDPTELVPTTTSSASTTLLTTPPQPETILITTPSLSNDPFVKRFFVLTMVSIEYGDPSPTTKTQTWAFSSQFKAVSRALQVAMKVIMSRHDDYQETIDRDDPINDDLAYLVEVIPQTSGLNGYEEKVAKTDSKLLFQCWDKIAQYFLVNNNIHSGTYHSFLLTRYMINDHERKTYTRDIDIHRSTEDQRVNFLQ